MSTERHSGSPEAEAAKEIADLGAALGHTKFPRTVRHALPSGAIGTFSLVGATPEDKPIYCDGRYFRSTAISLRCAAMTACSPVCTSAPTGHHSRSAAAESAAR